MNCIHALSTLTVVALSISRLTLPVLAGEPSGTAASPANSELSTVLYPVSGLGRAAQPSQQELAVLPFLAREESEEKSSEEDFGEALYLLLADDLFSDEFQYEGREIELLTDGQLLITAPTQVHVAVAALLNYLDAAWSRQAVVRWEVYQLTYAGAAPTSASLEQLLQAGQAELLQSRRETVPLGRTVLRRSERTEQWLQGWQTEMAVGAAGQVPKLQNLIGGMTLLLRVEDLPRGQGQRLRMVQRLVGEPTLLSVDAGTRDVAVGDDGATTLSRQRSLELFRASATTLSGAAVLSEGQELRASAWCRGLSGVSGRLTRLVLEQVDPAPAPVQVAGKEMRLLDLSALTWSGWKAPATHSWALQGRLGREWTGSYREQFDEGALRFPGEGSVWDSTVSPVVQPFEWEGGSAWNLDNWLFLGGSSEELEGLVSLLGTRQPTTRGVVFEWAIEDGEGARLAGGRLDLEEQSDGLVLVGEALSYLHGGELDVASNALSLHGVAAEAFDGLWLAVHPNGRGALALKLARNRLLSLTDESLGRGALGSFQRPVFESSDLNVSCPVDGRWHELGELSSGPGNARFKVRATMR